MEKMYKMKNERKGVVDYAFIFGNLSKNTVYSDSNGNFDCVCNTCWNENQTIHGWWNQTNDGNCESRNNDSTCKLMERQRPSCSPEPLSNSYIFSHISSKSLCSLHIDFCQWKLYDSNMKRWNTHRTSSYFHFLLAEYQAVALWLRAFAIILHSLRAVDHFATRTTR